jgi:hypothetical protein
MTTALDIIKRAMRQIGALAEGEVPTAQEEQDGLDAFNDVLETWSLESLSVYGSLPETFATIANTASYTIGVGGNFNTARPSFIYSGYVTVGGVDFTMSEITLEQYNTIALKTLSDGIPQNFCYVNDYPLGRVLLWPRPSAVIPIVFDTSRILTAVTTGAQVLSLPIGYKRALQYAVAVEMSPEYSTGVDVSQQAMKTKAIIKRANRIPAYATLDDALMQNGYMIPVVA